MATTDKSKVEQAMGIVHGMPYRSDHLANFALPPTADAVEEVFQLIRGYKSCVVSFIGANGSIGTPVVYRNELTTADPTIARSEEGKYTITFASAVLTASLTTALVSIGSTSLCTHIVDATVTNTTVITIDSGKVADGVADDIIGTLFCEIKVYGV